MKSRFLSIIGIFTLCAGLRAEIITLWNFNSAPPDGSTSTGTIAPATGSGTAVLLGGVSATFAPGSANDTNTDNTGWNTAAYPARDAGDKTAGVSFTVSTRNYSNIVVSFDQRVSPSASRYEVLQYSINGSDFTDLTSIEMTVANTFVSHSIDLSHLPGVNDNARFAFRVVTTFESSATGSGTNQYVPATGASYATSGTMRFDLVTVSGDPINPGNTPPFISGIPDQTVVENVPTGEIAFTVGDLETLPEDLVIEGMSSNSDLVPTNNIVFGGSGVSRTVNITPAPDKTGTTTITIIVSDAGGRSTNATFQLSVVSPNAAPTISAIPHQHTLVNTATAPIPFTIGDVETSAGALALARESSDRELVPVENIVFDGADTNRSVIITPAPGRTGTALITVTVTDAGGRSTESRFVLMVIPTITTVLYDSFGYATGPLITNSSFFWSNHSGTVGQLAVASGRINVSGHQGEDVHAPLLGAPYAAAGGVTLYASFTVRFGERPSPAGDYFAHYNSGTFRCRVFSAATNAAPGRFRLGIANGSGTPVQFPADLDTNTSYLVVTRYDVAAGTSTLWVNPTAESNPGTAASDSASAVTISSFAFRQDSGIGAMTVDDLKISTSFADVTGGPRLTITAVGSDVHISWPIAADGYVLQCAESLSPAGWSDYPDPPGTAGDENVVNISNVTGMRFYRLIKH